MSAHRCCSNLAAGVTLLLVASTLNAQSNAVASGAARWADSARRVLDAAVLRGDSAGIRAARRISERALLAFPDDGLLLHYQGSALWREGQWLAGHGNPEASVTAMEQAIAVLQRSAAQRPLPETQAILASAYGALAGGGVAAAMRYGPRANEAEGIARGMAPENPRVLLLGAISAYYKPAAFGGGKDKARQALAQALAGFARETVAAPLPSWGHAEALAWQGRFATDAGDTAAARAAYTQALALAPDYTWVHRVLLPALDRPR